MTHNDLRYGFGRYQLDPGKRILTRDGEAISLTSKATEILLVLVNHAGRLVEKNELLKEVWPDTFEEAKISQNIFTLRRALGDDRTGPKYIETIARRGYRFGLLVGVATERDARRLNESLSKLRYAASLEGTGPLATGATTLKELANAECDAQYADEAALHFQRALYKFEAVGHHRFVISKTNSLHSRRKRSTVL
jgi:DNA-binding winged helix-turn-helix (wHTH) protein